MRTKTDLKKLTKDQIITIYLKQQNTVKSLTKINIDKKYSGSETLEELKQSNITAESLYDANNRLQNKLKEEARQSNKTYKAQERRIRLYQDEIKEITGGIKHLIKAIDNTYPKSLCEITNC